MTPKELKEKFIRFFVEKGHKEIPSASLIPENDPSTLFISAGMHPLVPFLLGETHPLGKKLVDVQKCLRTDDIDNVGDGFHHTFFEMLGNWSLGDYFKKEAIEWSFEFLTSPQWLGLDPNKLYVTVFAGDGDAPLDEDSIKTWQAAFLKVGTPAKIGERIFLFGKKENWWGPVGNGGPCGPDTEIFFDTGKPKCKDKCDPSCQCGKYVEIWNNVFMQYNKTLEGKYIPLAQKNVDTGMGVERVTAITSGYGDDDYKTELFAPVVKKLEKISGLAYDESEEIKKAIRIISDHSRATTFLLADGVLPSNKDQGYILRRLIRKSLRLGRKLLINRPFLCGLASIIIEIYKDYYPELITRQNFILINISAEEKKFSQMLDRGIKEFEKIAMIEDHEKKITAEEAFDLYQSFGFPIEITEEMAREIGFSIDKKGFELRLKSHQDKSRETMNNKFVGGLVDHSEISTRYHTATHLLQSALRKLIGNHVSQKGSNITDERLRFDFSNPEKVSEEKLREVEALVNSWIDLEFPVEQELKNLEEAKSDGALAFFGEKYGDKVKVYVIKNPKTKEIISKEICGGPHVKNTKEIGRLKITKEEGVGDGVRRIKATLV